MKVQLDKEVVEKAVIYHCQEREGLTPVIESDADLAEWTEYVLHQVSGLEDSVPIDVSVAGDKVFIDGNKHVLEAIRHYVL